jgi:thymidylate kinase
MTPNIVHFLDVKERNRSKRIIKRKTNAQKKDRNKRIFDKIRNEEVIKRKERQ